MTIYDVLCYSKENCSLSGRFCSVNLLKGILQTGVPTGNHFQSSAEAFKGKTEELRNACRILGDPANLSGDISALIYAFPFLPIIIQYWEEDDEFPASLKFMFDENILQYMHYETVFYLMGSAIHRLKELSQHVQ